MEFIISASDKELDYKIWQMWLSLFPHMTKDTFVTFSDYKKKIMAQSKPQKRQTDNEMLAMCKLLNAAYGGEVVEK